MPFPSEDQKIFKESYQFVEDFKKRQKKLFSNYNFEISEIDFELNDSNKNDNKVISSIYSSINENDNKNETKEYSEKEKEEFKIPNSDGLDEYYQNFFD